MVNERLVLGRSSFPPIRTADATTTSAAEVYPTGARGVPSGATFDRLTKSLRGDVRALVARQMGLSGRSKRVPAPRRAAPQRASSRRTPPSCASSPPRATSPRPTAAFVHRDTAPSPHGTLARHLPPLPAAVTGVRQPIAPPIGDLFSPKIRRTYRVFVRYST